MFNHTRQFRPLRGGIEIYNPKVLETGTLGFVAQDVGDKPGRWLVSCYHVLVGGPDRKPMDGESVYQPSSDLRSPVAFIEGRRADPGLDCAAARISDDMTAVGEILGIGPLNAPAKPVVGMRVMKSGAETGVTEGIIEGVDGDVVIIGHVPGFDLNYEISSPGDSGSLWLRRSDLAPVAIHVRGVGDPLKRVEGRRISAVLAVLRLKIAR
jgi:hypothetical protein